MKKKKIETCMKIHQDYNDSLKKLQVQQSKPEKSSLMQKTSELVSVTSVWKPAKICARTHKLVQNKI